MHWDFGVVPSSYMPHSVNRRPNLLCQSRETVCLIDRTCCSESDLGAVWFQQNRLEEIDANRIDANTPNIAVLGGFGC